MSNMSYCRFENTLRDLRDCVDHLHDKLSEREKSCRKQLIKLCQAIADEFSDDDGGWAATDDDLDSLAENGRDP